MVGVELSMMAGGYPDDDRNSVVIWTQLPVHVLGVKRTSRIRLKGDTRYLDLFAEPRKLLWTEVQHLKGFPIAGARQAILIIDAFLAHQAAAACSSKSGGTSEPIHLAYAGSHSDIFVGWLSTTL